MLFKQHPERVPQFILSMPFIYGMIIPSVFLDLCIEIYHRFCFMLYGIPYVDRSKYIKIDRHRLEYLSLIEKINCAYCGYVNGLFAYAVVIAGETEKYWCGIMHRKDPEYVIPPHHKNFARYGDEKDLKNKYLN